MLSDFGSVLSSDNLQRLLVGDYFRTGQVGGFALTIILGFLSIFFATIIGVVVGMMRHSQVALIRWPATLFINLFRSIPVLVVIFWVYFVPPQLLGVTISSFKSTLIALSLFSGAYIAEVIRSGLNSVPTSQIQAGRTLGLTRSQVYMYIIIPQAVYAMLPALTGRYIVTIKNTSLAFLIGLVDVNEIGRQISGRLMNAPGEVYVVILLLYYVLNTSIAYLMSRMETRATFNQIFRRLRA